MPFGWHQDNGYGELDPYNSLTTLTALDDADEENGCLRYIKGSHLKGLRPHNQTKTLGFSQGISDFNDDDRESESPIIAQPGDVLIHHGNTIHRANPNRSTTRHRRSFGMVFQANSAKRDENAFAHARHFGRGGGPPWFLGSGREHRAQRHRRPTECRGQEI